MRLTSAPVPLSTWSPPTPTTPSPKRPLPATQTPKATPKRRRKDSELVNNAILPPTATLDSNIFFYTPLAPTSERPSSPVSAHAAPTPSSPQSAAPAPPSQAPPGNHAALEETLIRLRADHARLARLNTEQEKLIASQRKELDDIARQSQNEAREKKVPDSSDELYERMKRIRSEQEQRIKAKLEAEKQLQAELSKAESEATKLRNGNSMLKKRAEAREEQIVRVQARADSLQEKVRELEAKQLPEDEKKRLEEAVRARENELQVALTRVSELEKGMKAAQEEAQLHKSTLTCKEGEMGKLREELGEKVAELEGERATTSDLRARVHALEQTAASACPIATAVDDVQPDTKIRQPDPTVEMEGLRHKVKELKERNKVLKIEQQGRQDRMAAKQRSMESLRTELAQAKNRIDRLENAPTLSADQEERYKYELEQNQQEKASLVDANRTLAEQLAASEAQADEHMNELLAAQQTVQELESERTKLQIRMEADRDAHQCEIEGKDTLLKRAARAYAELKVKEGDARLAIAASEELRMGAEEATRSVAAALETARTTLARLERESQEKDETMQAKDAEVVILRDRDCKIDEEMQSMLAESAATKAAFLDLQTRLAQKEKDLQRQTKRASEALGQVEEMQRLVEETRESCEDSISDRDKELIQQRLRVVEVEMEVETLESQVQEREKGLKLRQSEVVELKAKVEELANRDTEQGRREVAQEIATMVATFKSATATLESSLAEQRRQHAGITAEKDAAVESSNRRVAELDLQVVRLQSALQDKSQALYTEVGRTTELRAAVTELRAAVTELQEKKRQLKRFLFEAEQKIHAARQGSIGSTSTPAHPFAHDTREDHEEVVKRLNAEVGRLQGELARLQASTKSLREERDAMTEQRDALQERWDRVEGERDTLHQRITKLEESIASVVAERDVALARQTELQGTCARLEGERAELERRVAAAESRVVSEEEVKLSEVYARLLEEKEVVAKRAEEMEEEAGKLCGELNSARCQVGLTERLFEVEQRRMEDRLAEQRSHWANKEKLWVEKEGIWQREKNMLERERDWQVKQETDRTEFSLESLFSKQSMARSRTF